MRNCRRGGVLYGIIVFLYGNASPAAQVWKGRAGLNQKPVPHPRALLQAADSKSLNMEATRLDRRRAAEPVRRTMFYAPTQSCWPCGGDSGAHWKRDKVRTSGLMFHVKQFIIHNSEFHSSLLTPNSPSTSH